MYQYVDLILIDSFIDPFTEILKIVEDIFLNQISYWDIFVDEGLNMFGLFKLTTGTNGFDMVSLQNTLFNRLERS